MPNPYVVLQPVVSNRRPRAAATYARLHQVVADFPDASEITTHAFPPKPSITPARLICLFRYPESERALLDYAAMTSAISHYPPPPSFAPPSFSTGSKRELFAFDAVVGLGAAPNTAWPPPSPAQKP